MSEISIDNRSDASPAEQPELRTMAAIRNYIADVLESSRTKPLTSYEDGFQRSFDFLAILLLDPVGDDDDDDDRPTTELIENLRRVPGANCKATLQTIKAFRDELFRFFGDLERSPSTTRYIDGREDAYRHMWCKIDLMGLVYD
jgi:hypothetical protein